MWVVGGGISACGGGIFALGCVCLAKGEGWWKGLAWEKVGGGSGVSVREKVFSGVGYGVFRPWEKADGDAWRGRSWVKPDGVCLVCMRLGQCRRLMAGVHASWAVQQLLF
ncbi:hypothetical protein LOK49_LG01G01706 [Camellia lanceoleosa]|uniref:Uncharacterized protein n=1 Tax=Camellia lanceoleosa TaxID=1840588 RepID=A0ACC0IVY0_9ERIC|nr:hypothetical protein LOK49_LG01G01706 [Camellia lanceoleosa]